MRKKYLKLQHLIIGVAILAFALTIGSSLLSSYRMNKQTLMDNTLETNRVYAEKLATTANNYLNETLQTLTYNTNILATYINDEKRLLEEADRLKMQTNTFNSVSIIDKKGEIIATSPQSLNLKGRMADLPAVKKALKEQEPMVSDPFRGLTQKELIFISAPIFSNNGKYLGLVGGTIYLEESNILYELLGNHFYNDGSYVYVVDRGGRIIYHQDHSRINEVIKNNAVIQKIMSREPNGAQRVINSKGKDMLAGYAIVGNAGWGVVAQRPTDISLEPAVTMVKQMLYVAFPLLIVTLVIIIWAALKISKPLQRLAELAENSMQKDESKNLSDVKAWYYEVRQLKTALIQSLSFLHQQVTFFMDQSTTDPLTGLTNRRTLDVKLKEFTTEKIPFSLVIMDIDHFKAVNDTYGHNVGDEVIQFLASQIRSVARPSDICCRYGGEEFIMVLPYTNNQQAFDIAENLRRELEATNSPTGEPITISAGIAEYNHADMSPSMLIGKADECLYQAKKQGRNQIVIASS